MPEQNLANKGLVYDFLSQVERLRHSPTALGDYFADDVVWRGCAPFDTQAGPNSLWQVFWQPLFASFSNLQRRIDILLGGVCESEHWVANTGYLFGRFEGTWLGIPPSNQETFLRYGEFYRIEAGKINKAFALYDLIEVMQQAGCDPLPPSLGLAGFVPPPRSADGLLLNDQAPGESAKTFQIAYDMLFQGMNEFDQKNKESMQFTRYWQDNMHWYGPASIGTTRDLNEFEENHQLPWLRAFPDRQVVWESPMFADGIYAATAGWREVVATHSGEYLGYPPTGKRIEFRVMDFWRREGDLLSENWVLIDLIDAFRQFGVDLFARLAQSGDSS